MTTVDRGGVIYALLLREIRSRSPATRLGFLMDLALPCMQLAMMYTVFWAIGRKPDFGGNLFVFLFSGVVPYFLFTHVASRVMGTLPRVRVLRPFGVVQPIDVATMLMVLELIAISLLGTVSVLAAVAAGVSNAVPNDFLQIVLSMVVLAFTGLGVGLCNSYLVQIFAPWRILWTVLARSLIFLSGVFYTVDFFPPVGRRILWWNPLLHGIIWFRSGMFAHYPNQTLSVSYLLTWCIGSLLLALILERIIQPEGA